MIVKYVKPDDDKVYEVRDVTRIVSSSLLNTKGRDKHMHLSVKGQPYRTTIILDEIENFEIYSDGDA
jgi:hypothetical protein